MLNLSDSIWLLLLAPLSGIFLVPIKKKHRSLFYILQTSIPIFNAALLLGSGVQKETVFFGPFAFSLDQFSFLFALILNVAWAMTIIYSSDFVRYQFRERAEVFYRAVSIAVTIITGAGISANLFTLFLFYVLSIPVIYPLVVFRGSDESKVAGKWYLWSTLGPTLCIALPALLYVGHWFAPFQQWSIREVTTSPVSASLILAALIIGFSKNCVAPFWGWLPRTSMAPAPVSGLIHSVGAVHTGTISILKIIVYVFGYDYMSALSRHFFQAGWLIYLCGFTAVYTAVCAYRSQDLKKRFSYSTVGQLSFVITAGLVGTPGSVLGALLHIVSHSIAKLNLFFVAGAFNSVYGTVDAKEVAKIIAHERWLAIPVGIAGLSITGFPFLAGYYSKDVMLLEEIVNHQYAAAAFLLTGSVVNFLYIYPVLKAACQKTVSDGFVKRKIPGGLTAAIFINTLLIIGLSFYTAHMTKSLLGK